MNEVVKIQAAAERARDGYRHEEAVAIYTQCLDLLRTSGIGDPALEYDLLDGRAGEYRHLGDFPAAIADYKAATATAEILGDLSRQAKALNNQADLTLNVVGLTEAESLVGRALDIAVGVNDIGQVAFSHRVRGSIFSYKGSHSKALEEHQQAVNLYRQVGDLAGEARSLSSMVLVSAFLGQPDPNAKFAKDALIIARQIEDREIEALTLNYIGMSLPNIAEARSLLEQSLNLFQSIDNRRGKSFVANNLSMLFYRLGMYRRGLAYAKQQIADLPEDPTVRLYHADLIGLNALGLNMFDEAESAWLTGLKTANELGARDLELWSNAGLGLIALRKGQTAEANQIFHKLQQRLRDEDGDSQLAYVLAWRSAALLDLDEVKEAVSCSAEAADLEKAGIVSSDYHDQEIWWYRYRALATAGENEDAWLALDQARTIMVEKVAALNDEGLRRNYFNKVAVNRDIIPNWLEEAAERGLPLDPLVGELSGTSDLQEQFRRLNEIGIRLNARRDEDELSAIRSTDLPTFILDELIELTGAEQAALILVDEHDRPHLAAAELSAERTPTLVREIKPLLDETGLKRKSYLGYTPEEGIEIAQTSILCIPLVTHNETLGWLYAELAGIYGRFTRQDLDLTNVLANQAAVAVENANWAETLEQKVERRTAQLQAVNAELGIINSVQSGLVAQVDFQGVLDLVGDKLRETFEVTGLAISLFDRQADLIRPLYYFELGQRIDRDYQPVKPGPLSQFMMEKREPVIWNSDVTGHLGELDSIWAEPVPKSTILVPLIMAGEWPLTDHHQQHGDGFGECTALRRSATGPPGG